MDAAVMRDCSGVTRTSGRLLDRVTAAFGKEELI